MNNKTALVAVAGSGLALVLFGNILVTLLAIAVLSGGVYSLTRNNSTAPAISAASTIIKQIGR